MHSPNFLKSAKPIFQIIFFAAFFLLTPSSLFAGEMIMESVELVEQDSAADTIKIEFDIEWANSWRDTLNHDALWVFAKFCKSACTTNGTWRHAYLKTSGANPTGFDDGTSGSSTYNYTSLNLLVPTDKTGVFIYGGGAFVSSQAGNKQAPNWDNVQLVWDYAQSHFGTAGLTDSEAIASTTRVRIYAIEMVYIPEGGFTLGDGGDGTHDEFEFGGVNSSSPGVIASEEALLFQNAVNYWYYNSDSTTFDDPNATVFTLPGAFPKGFRAFYMMKYELSQGAYRDFLNTLTRTQQDTRVASDLSNADEDDANTYVMVAEGQTAVSFRQTIKAGANPGSGNPYTFGCDYDGGGTPDSVLNEINDGEWIAANYLSWMDLMAYADWAGLRPMTELEFEKAARGFASAVVHEYAWGTTTYTNADTISFPGNAYEVVDEITLELVNWNNATSGTQGPLRSGYAASSSNKGTRRSASASYFGVYDLSGNVSEKAVTVGNATGRQFAGSHGDGILTTAANAAGNATNEDWPGYIFDNTNGTDSGVSGALGGGLRGNSWSSATTTWLEISGRSEAGNGNSERYEFRGGRLVRTADV